MKAGLNGRKRNGWSNSRLTSPHAGVEQYFVKNDKPPVFILAYRSTGERHVIPAKAADESKIRPLLANRQQESLIVYTDGFQAYELLGEDDAFTREYIIYGDGEYADGERSRERVQESRSVVRSWPSCPLRRLQG